MEKGEGECLLSSVMGSNSETVVLVGSHSEEGEEVFVAWICAEVDQDHSQNLNQENGGE